MQKIFRLNFVYFFFYFFGLPIISFVLRIDKCCYKRIPLVINISPMSLEDRERPSLKGLLIIESFVQIGHQSEGEKRYYNVIWFPICSVLISKYQM